MGFFRQILFLISLSFVLSSRPIDCSENHYRTLNLTEKATIPEIKKAFKELSKLYHPDKTKNIYNHEYYKDIVTAHSILITVVQVKFDPKIFF